MTAPKRAWVTDISYIRILEGFAYPAVAIDLNSRRVVGWSTRIRQTTDVVLQAPHMALWRRKPKQRVLIHPDQGSQFTSRDWAAFIRAHNLEHPMSGRGHCHDNAVAGPAKPARRPGRTCSTTSRWTTTRCASMSATGCCHPSSSNGSRF